MLRRKLLIVFGSLVALLAVMAIVSLWMLYDVLERLDHVNTHAVAIMDRTSELAALLTAIEVDLYQLRLHREHRLDALIDDVQALQRLSRDIGEHYVVHEPAIRAAHAGLLEAYPAFEHEVSSLATAQDDALSQIHIARALGHALTMRQNAEVIRREARAHGRQEQRDVAARFRWLVLGFAVGALLVINVSILALLRTAGMILAPVDTLVEASRELTLERFDHRAHVDPGDEFSELAAAYNALAERMQTNERRIVETLGHLAVALNHELNNALATADLQLQLLSRRAGRNEKLEAGVREIQRMLRHMAGTVESIKHIRRVVLTDYGDGAKMLDIQRSTALERNDGAGETDNPDANP